MTPPFGQGRLGSSDVNYVNPEQELRREFDGILSDEIIAQVGSEFASESRTWETIVYPAPLTQAAIEVKAGHQQAILDRLDAVEFALREIAVRHGNLGHNNRLLNDQEAAETTSAVTTIRKYVQSDDNISEHIEPQVSTLKRISATVGSILVEILKATGKKMVIDWFTPTLRNALAYLYSNLVELINLLQTWISRIH